MERLAHRALRGEAGGHTLESDALIHEAYLRLLGARVPWQDRLHFFAVAARTMRRVLVDHARARRRERRGGGGIAVTLKEGMAAVASRPVDVLALDAALERLSAVDERAAHAVELHCFGGLTAKETAAALDVSQATVNRVLRFAKAWLYRELQDDPEAER